jgi:hypothetical protein
MFASAIAKTIASEKSRIASRVVMQPITTLAQKIA